jgi:hypothetical protein
MVRKKKRRTTTIHRRRRHREEQLELDLAPRDHGVTHATPDLSGTGRIPAANETQTKRLRAGVLVQQMLK